MTQLLFSLIFSGLLQANIGFQNVSTYTPIQMTDREIINQYPHSDILWMVYGLESSRGKHDSCKYKGGVNGFGYTSNKRCFKDFDEAARTVSNWFTQRLGKYSLNEGLCIYNTGDTRGGNCCYAKRFHGQQCQILSGSGSLL